MSEPTFPRSFVVQRDEDVSGISGEGVVAEGVQFSDGWVVTHWLDQPPMNEPKTDVWHNKGAEPFEKIHGHSGATRILWADEIAAARRKLSADIIQAFDVPGWIAGLETEREVLRRQITRAVQSVQDGEAAPVEVGDERIVDAVMPIVRQVLEQRSELRAEIARLEARDTPTWRQRAETAEVTAARAYLLADRWEAAHGSSMFLVRSAGAELRDELGESGATPCEVAHSGEKYKASATDRVDDPDDGEEFDGPLVPSAVTEAIRRQEAATADDLRNLRQRHAGPDAEPCTKHVGRVERQRYGCNGADPADTRRPPMDPVHILGVEAPAGCCEHRGMHPGFTCAEVDETKPYWNVRWGQEYATARHVAAGCSAEYQALASGRQCIRAAQHRGDHIDEHGFHWSDTVAVYPVVGGEPRLRRTTSSCSTPEHACLTCGDCVYDHPGEVGCLRPQTAAQRDRGLLVGSGGVKFYSLAEDRAEDRIEELVDTVRSVLGIDDRTVPADVNTWLLTACRQLEKSEEAREHLRGQRNEVAQALREALAAFREEKGFVNGTVLGYRAPHPIHPSDFNRWRSALKGLPANCQKPGGCSDCPHEMGA